jgi:hypothetical protein
MTVKEKDVSWQGWMLLILWLGIGMFVGSLLELILGIWVILPSGAIVIGITIYGGTIKNWIFNIELVDDSTIKKDKPE